MGDIFLFSYFKQFLNLYFFIFWIFDLQYIFKMFEIRKNKFPIVPLELITNAVSSIVFYLCNWDNGTFLFSYFKHFLNLYIFIFLIFDFIYIFKMFEIRENKSPIVPRIRKCSRLERGIIRYFELYRCTYYYVCTLLLLLACDV